jgi:hypothetical protein
LPDAKAEAAELVRARRLCAGISPTAEGREVEAADEGRLIASRRSSIDMLPDAEALGDAPRLVWEGVRLGAERVRSLAEGAEGERLAGAPAAVEEPAAGAGAGAAAAVAGS